MLASPCSAPRTCAAETSGAGSCETPKFARPKNAYSRISTASGSERGSSNRPIDRASLATARGTDSAVRLSVNLPMRREVECVTMNFEEATEYLYGLGNETLAMKLGLESVRALASALDDPQRKFPAVHIAGTNGKGSTAAMTASVLRAAGLSAGLYTSPHLVSITERIRIGDDEIAPNEFARLATDVRAAGERLVAEGALPASPTFFEQVTMIAYLYFAERKVDLAVLEVGLGGRLDATNICEPVVTAITPVGFDHQKYLGDTLASIAGEKAGIVKPGIPVVIAPQSREAMAAIIARCEELDAPAIQTLTPFDVEAAEGVENIGRHRFRYRVSRDEYDVRLGLRGRHQITNAVVAIHIAEQLQAAGFDIPSAAIIEGLNEAEWPG